MRKTIGIIGGTGKQGTALAKRLVKNGFEVKIGSRSEERGENHASDLREKLSTELIVGGDNVFAINSDVLVLAIPFDQVDPLLGPHKEKLQGKLIMDMTVNLSFGKFIKAHKYNGMSSYEYIRDIFDRSEVVACLKTISFTLLDRDIPLDQTDFQMTTSDDAYEFTSNLASKFGLDPVRVRGKDHAHTIERMVALSIQLNKSYKGSHVGFLLKNLKN